MSEVSERMRDAFEAVAIDDEGRACRDIPDSVCHEEPRNFFVHVGSLALTKSSDGLIDPKLVLSWLLTELAAPVFFVGLLVPIREAGALLPQMFTAGAIRRLPVRKWVWAAGSLVQGLAAAMIAICALTLDGATAGWAIILALTVLAIARSACSVSYKDVLGKTVSKSTRGTATGLAGSLAAAATIVYALTLISGLVPRMSLVIGGLFVAAGCWLIAAAVFSTLHEEPGASDGGKNAFKTAIRDMKYLKSDEQLRRFIIVRALLTTTALAPPFMIAAASENGGGGFGGLGYLVLASAGAGLVSAYVWGRLADRSSRKVLLIASVLSMAVLLLTLWSSVAGWLSAPFILPVLLFSIMIAYKGVRLGRSTHLTDMATAETRAAYTALSNTIIGLVLFAGGLFSFIAEVYGVTLVLGVMAVMCAAAVPFALALEEVQADSDAG
ncbi:MFS transporter [Hoeflea sp.]|uniref:MFS transporter n=1 Tax=Hoeflea sp. TaxID=1940281 RepID=UPI003B521F25